MSAGTGPTARELAARWGLSKTSRGYRGACPLCAGDAFVVHPGKGGPPVLRCYYSGCEAADLHRAAERAVGGTWTAPERKTPDAADDAARTAEAMAVWDGAVPALGTPADTYLTGRALPGLAASPALRWRPEVKHPTRRVLPAMVALVVDVDGTPRAVHRHYLRRDGSGKADVRPPKASKGPVGGCAIRLDPAASELVIAEGVETAASAGRLLSLPAWSAVSCVNLRWTMRLPAEVRSVVIAADLDPAGMMAVEAAVERWETEGRRVRVALPPAPELDCNDLLLAAWRGTGAARG